MKIFITLSILAFSFGSYASSQCDYAIEHVAKTSANYGNSTAKYTIANELPEEYDKSKVIAKKNLDENLKKARAAISDAKAACR